MLKNTVTAYWLFPVVSFPHEQTSRFLFSHSSFIINIINIALTLDALTTHHINTSAAMCFGGIGKHNEGRVLS